MLAAAIAGIGTMLLITGVIPALAIATVSVVEIGLKKRSAWPAVRRGGELEILAARLRIRA